MKRRHWMAIDFIVGGFAAMICLLLAMKSGPEVTPVPAGSPVAHSVGVLPSLAIATTILLAIGLRRRGPMSAFMALTGIAVIAAQWPDPLPLEGVVLLAQAYVLYMVTVACARRTGVLALAFCLAEVLGVDLLVNGDPSHRSGPAIPVALALCIAWMIGYSVRQRRAYIEMLQVQAASSAVEQERLRIARELHDVVAHSMSVIAVQAGFGEYVIDTRPEDAREALCTIQATSREALAELRRMLGVLRRQETGAAPLTPEPRLPDLDRLIERTRAAGIEVGLIRLGTARDLPASVDVSAYRIVQEALTNVVRHAGGGATCAVTVTYGEDALAIEVIDDGGLGGTRHHSPGCGHGLIGMRERVHLCRGELSAGPLPHGGFRVRARLPVPAVPRPEPATLAAAAS
jgi:signal transduction histidine kinase